MYKIIFIALSFMTLTACKPSDEAAAADMTDWNNKEEVMEAVRKGGWNLDQASDELRGDRELIHII